MCDSRRVKQEFIFYNDPLNGNLTYIFHTTNVEIKLLSLIFQIDVDDDKQSSNRNFRLKNILQ